MEVVHKLLEVRGIVRCVSDYRPDTIMFTIKRALQGIGLEIVNLDVSTFDGAALKTEREEIIEN